MLGWIYYYSSNKPSSQPKKQGATMDLTEANSIETDDVELCHPETLSLSYGYNPQDFDGAIKVCIFASH